MTSGDSVEEAARRITALLVSKMREYPSVSVEWCAYFAALEETFINGDPRSPTPVGLLNVTHAKP